MKDTISRLSCYVWIPNIEGEAHYGHNGVLSQNGTVSGGFKLIDCDESDAASGQGTYSYDLGFDASKSSAVYAGDKVQSASLQVLCCIKI